MKDARGRRIRVKRPRFERSTAGQEEHACVKCGRPIFLMPSKAKESMRHFCDVPCRSAWLTDNRGIFHIAENPERRKKKLGDKNPRWGGDNVGANAGRTRAQRMFQLGKCDLCNKPAVDRHHRNGNTLDNRPENIQPLCRSCHMKVDGRLKNLEKCRIARKAA